MEADTRFRVGRVFRAWRLQAFGIWITTGFFKVSVPRRQPIAEQAEPTQEAIEDPEHLWPNTDDGF